MHTPTKKQWQTVIDNLTKVLPMAKGKEALDMQEAAVKNESHICGTVHCFGGWYAVAVIDHDQEFISYTNGAREMAKHLGLKNDDALEEWAELNPEIWGNVHGGSLFWSVSAFDNCDTLSGIVEYLKGVRDRSPD